VRTVHDPYGTGACGVFLGGSDLAGVARAVEEFAALLPAGDDIAMPHTVALEGPAISAPLTPAAADGIIATLAKANFRLVGARASGGCLSYHRTGDPEQARIARAALDRLAKIVSGMKTIGDTRGVVFLPTLFDLAEENDVWTDADRDRLSRFMYEFATKCPYADGEIEPSPVPHGNNWNIRTSWAAARYFEKYYGMDVKGLVGKCDRYFASMMTWKSREDCPGYGSMTVIDTLHYVLKKPDLHYFESGLARQMAEYEMTVTNNMGAATGFGDISSHGSSVHFPGAMAALAWYYRDGRYLWMLQKMANANPGGEFLGSAWALDGLEPAEPTDLLGVHVLPLESWIYDNRDDVLGTGVATTDEILRAGEDPPHEQCFDKVSFRDSFDEDRQYLLLGGVSHGYHAHPDGNAIIAFTDEGKLWIFDNGYFVPDTVEQNTIAVYRDGQFEPVPSLTALDARADLPGVGMTQTSVRAYNGTNWQRNIIWAKERWFVVLDELIAREAGDFGAQCIFRTIGEREMQADRALVRQGEARFALVTDGRPVWSVHQVTPLAANRRGLFENQDAELAAGESMTFQNLFYCPEGEGDFPYDLARVAPTGALVSGPEGVAFAGAGAVSMDGLPTVDAAVFLLTASSVSLADGRGLTWRELVFSCEGVADLHLDMVAGTGVIEADAAVTVQLAGLAQLKIDGQAAGAPIELAAGRHELSFTAAPVFEQRQASLRDAFAGANSDKQAMLAARAVSTGEQVNDLARVRFETEQVREVFVDEAGEELTNLARTGVASAWTDAQKGCGARNATDGNLESYSAVGSSAPHTSNLPKDLGVEWAEPVTVSQAWFWHYSKQYVPAEDGHDIQYWDGEDGWVSVDDEVREHDAATWVHTFAPVTTTRLRLLVTKFSESRTAIREMNFFERPATIEERVFITPDPVHAMITADLDDDLADEALVCVGNDVVALTLGREAQTPDGSDLILWRAPVGEGYGKCLAAYDLDGDGALEVIVGGSDHKVHCFAADGSVVWVADCPSDPFQPEREPMTGTIDVIAAGDTNQDGMGEVVFGSANWFAYALDHAGELLWTALNWAHPPLDIALFDVTGDGNLEALIATKYNTANLFNSAGKLVDRVDAGYHGIPLSVACGDMDGNGQVEMLMGSRIGGVHCKEHGGERLWSLNMGARVTDVAVADVTGDEGLEALACSANRYVICADADGEVLWRRNVGGAATQMVVADVTGDGRPEILVCVQDASPVLLSGDGEVLARIPTMAFPSHIAVADVTGDGAPALLTASDGVVEAVGVE
jgi:outer membrane protein assembly factor BamB